MELDLISMGLVLFLRFLTYSGYSKNMLMKGIMRPFYEIKITISDFVHNYVPLSLEKSKYYTTSGIMS